MTETRVATRHRAEGAPVAWGLVIAATLLAAGTIAVIWLAAVPWGPMVCPAIYPAPRNCFEADRAITGVLVTIVVLVVWIATVLLALVGRRRRGPVIAGVVLLALAPVLSYLAVAWIPAAYPGL